MNLIRKILFVLTIAVVGVVILLLQACASQSSQNDTNSEKSSNASESAISNTTFDEKTYAEIKQLILDKHYPPAEAKLRLLTTKFPNHAGIWANLGIIYSETNRLPDAEKALQKAIHLNSRVAEIYTRLGAVLKKQGKIPQAVEMYNKALQIDANYANAHYNIAVIYDIYLQDPKSAVSHIERYLKIVGDEDEDAKKWQIHLQRQIPTDK